MNRTDLRWRLATMYANRMIVGGCAILILLYAMGWPSP